MTAQRRASAVQPAARQLGEQDIVDAALRLIRKEGTEKLTMRTLAAELGVTAMAIYYHVPNKEALLDLVVDSVLSGVPMPAPSSERWQAQMKAYVLTSRQLIGAYPGLSRVIVERSNSKAVRALFRYGISLLLAAGFDAREAALAITTYNTYLFGVYGVMAAKPGHGAARKRSLRRAPSTLPETGIDAVARHMHELSWEDLLDYGIDAVIEGIAARAKRKPAGKSLAQRAF